MEAEDFSWHPIMRSILNHWVWKERPFSKGQAWLDMILLAQFQPQKRMVQGHLIDLEVGDLCWPKYKLSERWGWSQDKVGRFLDALEGESMVRVKTEQRLTVIKLLNYKTLHEMVINGQVAKPGTDREPTENRQVAIQKGIKKEKGRRVKNVLAHVDAENLPPAPPDPANLEATKAAIRPKATKTQIPEDWALPAGMVEWCAAHHLPDPEYQRGVFVDYFRAKGEARADWAASFRNWMRSPYRKDKETHHGTHRQPASGFESAQQRRDRRLREVLARHGNPAQGGGGADHSDVHVGAEGAP